MAVVKEDEKDIVKLFARTNPMVISAPLYRKSIFLTIGLFDEGLSALEDWDFHFRCVVNGIIFQHSGYSPKSKTLIRIHDSSMSANRRNMVANLKKIQQKHKSNDVFALENGLIATSFGRTALHLVKMFVPPVFIWMLKKILGIV